MLLYNCQRAIYKALSNKLECPFNDYYPDATEESFPFIILEEVTKTPNSAWSTRDSEVYDIQVTLNVWGDSKSRKKVSEIAKVIEGLLTHDLSIDELNFEFEEVISGRLARTQENFVNREIILSYRVEV